MTIPPNPHPEQVEDLPDDMIPVPRGLLAAACYCIRKVNGVDSETYRRLSALSLSDASLANRPADDGEPRKIIQGLLDLTPIGWSINPKEKAAVLRARRYLAALPPQPEGVKRP